MFNPPAFGGPPNPGGYRSFGANPYTPPRAAGVPPPADHLRRPGVGANSYPVAPASSDYNNGAPSTLAPVPFTLDQQLRTVFIGKIPKSVDEIWLNKYLVQIPDLVKWIRVRDGKGNLSRFGFALFSTPESISLGMDVLRSLDFPGPSSSKSDDQVSKERVQFSIHIQDNTKEIVDSFTQSLQGDAKAAYDAKLTETVASLKAAIDNIGKEEDHQVETNGEMEKTVEEAERLEKRQQENDHDHDDDSNDTKTFSVNAEDLNHIPAAQRELVAQEIANFRERSRKRDEEKLRKAQEFETRTLEREKRARQKSVDIKASVPVQRDEFDSTGDSDSSNESGDEGASDQVLEEQAQERRQNDLLRQFHERESRWLKREDQRTHALERERTRDEQSDAKIAERRQETIKELAAFDDRQDSIRRNFQFYYDRDGWAKNRKATLLRERHTDEQVRLAEEREMKEEAAAAAKKEAREAQPQRFKLSLGPAAKPSSESTRRPTTEVEKLLEDEEDSSDLKKRVLVPLDYSNAKQELDEESREQLIRQLASEVPADKEGLWNWPIDWSLLDNEILNDKLVPFITNKIVEYLGVQEQDLIDFVKNHIETHQDANSLQEEMQMALDEDAEIFVKRVWRMLVFELEFKKRALGA